jgi:hypothetical protein
MRRLQPINLKGDENMRHVAVGSDTLQSENRIIKHQDTDQQVAS